MGLKGGGAKAEDCTHLSRDKLRALVKTQIKIRVPWNARKFLFSRAAQDVRFSMALRLRQAMSLAKHAIESVTISWAT
jgi:hypothetical protein